MRLRISSVLVACTLVAACQVVGSIDDKTLTPRDAGLDAPSRDAGLDAPNRDAGLDAPSRDAEPDGGAACAPIAPQPDQAYFPVGSDGFDKSGIKVSSTGRTVFDSKTGLEWEAKPADYQTYDEAQCRCRALRLDGKSDWRLASRFELLSLLDYTKVITALLGPALDTSIFGQAPADYYWTSTIYRSDNPASVNVPYLVEIGDGQSEGAAQTGAERASGWCVRGGNQPSSATRFTFTADTVTDAWTQLVWQRNMPAAAENVTPAQASAYCSALVLDGKGGFRVPGVKELQTIVAVGHRDPAIDTGLFPATPSARFHTSALFTLQPNDTRWYVDFSDGSAVPVTNQVVQNVRCVRSAP